MGYKSFRASLLAPSGMNSYHKMLSSLGSAQSCSACHLAWNTEVLAKLAPPCTGTRESLAKWCPLPMAVATSLEHLTLGWT